MKRNYLLAITLLCSLFSTTEMFAQKAKPAKKTAKQLESARQYKASSFRSNAQVELDTAHDKCGSSAVRKECARIKKLVAKKKYEQAKRAIDRVLKKAKKRGVEDEAIDSLQKARRNIRAAKEADKKKKDDASKEATAEETVQEAAEHETSSSRRRALENAKSALKRKNFKAAKKHLAKAKEGNKDDQRKRITRAETAVNKAETAAISAAEEKKRKAAEKRKKIEAERKKKVEETRKKQEQEKKRKEKERQQDLENFSINPYPVGPSNVVSGEVVTMSVVGPQNMVSGAVIEVGGEQHKTDSRGRATFKVPAVIAGGALLVKSILTNGSSRATRLPVLTGEEPPLFDPGKPPLIDDMPGFQDAAKPLRISGSNFDPTADGNAVRLGTGNVDVVASSSRELTLLAPLGIGTGETMVLVRTKGGRAIGKMTLVRVLPRLESKQLMVGSPGRLIAQVVGTTEKVMLRFRNLSPGVLTFVSGAPQEELQTQGGVDNNAVLTFETVGAGSFNVAVDLVE